MKKNLFKFLGTIALAAVIGFAACSNGSTSGGGHTPCFKMAQLTA